MEPIAYDWDPRKNEQNIAQHGIDFEDATGVFDQPHLIVPSPRGDEARCIAVGLLEDRIIVVVYVDRDATRRLISARRAHPKERRRYDEFQDRLRATRPLGGR